MKICLLTENYYRGGLDTFIINLINGWPDKFDNFTIICNESHPGLIDIEKRVKKKVRFIFEGNFKTFLYKHQNDKFKKNIETLQDNVLMSLLLVMIDLG